MEKENRKPNLSLVDRDQPLEGALEKLQYIPCSPLVRLRTSMRDKFSFNTLEQAGRRHIGHMSNRNFCPESDQMLPRRFCFRDRLCSSDLASNANKWRTSWNDILETTTSANRSFAKRLPAISVGNDFSLVTRCGPCLRKNCSYDQHWHQNLRMRVAECSKI